MQILLVSKLWVISNRSIEYRYQMFFDLKLRTVAYNIEALEVVCEKYFEIGIVSIVMKSGIDIVIVRASIGGIFHLEIFNKHKIFDNLNIFYLSVLWEKATDHGFSRFVHPTHIQFPYQNTFVYAFGCHSLLCEFFSLLFRQFHEYVVYTQIIVDAVITKSNSDLLLFFFNFRLIITAFFSTSRSWVTVVMSILSALIIVVSFWIV